MTTRVVSPVSGLASPSLSVHAPPPHSAPRPSFDAEQLRPYVKKLLSSTLQGSQWDPRDKDRIKGWCKEISERVKVRMLEIQPHSFKYMVTTQITQNMGQGGLAGLACHWEDTDTVIQEMYTSDSMICVCVAFAIRMP